MEKKNPACTVRNGNGHGVSLYGTGRGQGVCADDGCHYNGCGEGKEGAVHGKRYAGDGA